jgi:hypothetical protein
VKIFLALFAVAVIGGAVVGAIGAQATDAPSVGALDVADGRVSNTEDNKHLASAVERWEADASDVGPGRPLVSQSADLLSNVGSADDTLTAFPTSRGAVCYHIRAAGTCGVLTGSAQITVSILWTRNSGGRVFGVAADEVARVQVVTGGLAHDALLRANGFYYELPEGIDSGDVERVISTLSDGSSHVVRVHE